MVGESSIAKQIRKWWSRRRNDRRSYKVRGAHLTTGCSGRADARCWCRAL